MKRTRADKGITSSINNTWIQTEYGDGESADKAGIIPVIIVNESITLTTAN